MPEPQTPITVYTTETCPYCHALMEWLDQEGIPYTEQPASESMVPIFTVPTTLINDVYIEGFDRAAINQALGR
jgi:glutaredoxin